MNDQSFTTTIAAGKSPQEVFGCITDVAKWWGGKDFKGNSTALHDEFIILHEGAHYSKQKLVEVIPGKRIVWLVTESKLYWIQDMNEWTNTKMIFDITTGEGQTTIQFTHEGLVPGKKCYAMCAQGWGMVIKEWLFQFITEGKAHFEL